MAKYIGYESQLQLGDDGSPEEFNEIPGVKDFEVPLVGSIDEVDVTTHDSPDGFKEYIAGLKDAGDISVDIVWDADDTVHQDLEEIAGDREVRNFRAIDPNDNGYEFSAFIRELNMALPVADAIVATMVLRLSGAVTAIT
jgi:predicted secreted protein